MEPLRVLIVEDLEDDAELLLRELRRGGYDISHERVFSAAAMNAALDKGGWQIVISDHNMPEFNAMQALRLVQERGLDIPFIIVSGSITEETAVGAMRAGVHDFITKGRLARLIPAVQRELKEADSRRRRRNVEEALHRREELYGLVIGATHDTIYDADVVKGTVWFSENFQTTFGYPPREEGYTGAWWQEQIHPDDRQRIWSEVQEILRRGGKSWSGEYRFRKADQSYVMVYNRGNVISGADGKPVRWVGSLMDISDKRKLEEQLLHSQKLDAIGQLAGGIAHDFNNLVSVILGYADFAIEGLKSEEMAAIRSDVEEIKRAAQRAAALTRQLLTFSRRQIMQLVVTDINVSVSGMENMLWRLIGENITLVTSLATDVGRIKADPGQIEQVILNLAVNARDAMPNGGKLSIETRNVDAAEVNPSGMDATMPAGRYVRLSATDNGTGMDERTKAHIFEPFFTTKEKGKGTGLGLSTVYGVVKQSNGFIRVDTELGKGTTFEIFFPIVTDAVDAGEAAPESEKPDKSPGTVLVVEDEPTIRSMIKRILSSRKNTILEAGTGEEGLAKATAHRGPIDLVITDVVMPGITGLQMAARLRDIHPEAKVLFMSGYTENAAELQAQQSHFLMKPFNSQALMRKIEDLLAETDGKGGR